MTNAYFGLSECKALAMTGFRCNRIDPLHLNNTFFAECAPHCSLCYNETECYECTQGYFLTENGDCQRKSNALWKCYCSYVPVIILPIGHKDEL